MTRHQLANNLAQTLTQGGWSVAEIERNLTRRFPTKAENLAKALGQDIFLALPGRYAPSPRAIAQVLNGLDGMQRLYRLCMRLGTWPAPDIEPPVMRPVGRLQGLAPPAITTLGDLAEWLFLTPERLNYLADIPGRHEAHGDRAVNHYNYNLVTKSSGGQRLIEAPKATLKSLQRQILRRILQVVPPHPDAFGFITGRGVVGAAARHANEASVVCFDLRDFFPTIGAGRVHGLFRCMGYPHEVAHCLTALCTNRTPERVLSNLPALTRPIYRVPHLPQGAPGSPMLSNLIAYRLDQRLSGLARRLDAQYSRYADDITFSGAHGIVATLLKAVPEIAADEGFAPHPNKTRVMRAGGRQQVTGIVVNRHLNIARAEFDRLKAILHACAKPDDSRLSDPGFRAHLEGRIGWVAQLNPSRAAGLFARYEAALTNRPA